jgi:DNA-binding NarL/FixJ family response regulator
MSLVAEASNGRDALLRFREHQPDITLMDLRLPDMSGIEAIAAIRAEFPTARILILTTFAGDVEIRRAVEAGAAAYLLKSMPPKELMDVIRRVDAGQTLLPEKKTDGPQAANAAASPGEDPSSQKTSTHGRGFFDWFRRK